MRYMSKSRKIIHIYCFIMFFFISLFMQTSNTILRIFTLHSDKVLFVSILIVCFYWFIYSILNADTSMRVEHQILCNTINDEKELKKARRNEGTINLLRIIIFILLALTLIIRLLILPYSLMLVDLYVYILILTLVYAFYGSLFAFATTRLDKRCACKPNSMGER